MAAVTTSNLRNRWVTEMLLKNALCWLLRTRKRIGATSEFSSWWVFVFMWNSKIVYWLQEFRAGQHQFSPMNQYNFPDEVVRVWSYLDQLMLYLIFAIIKPTFRYIISPHCVHLAGPSAVKQVATKIKANLNKNNYLYCLRTDIKSYYDSVNHGLLVTQLACHFHDPILLRYLNAIVTAAIDRNGQILLPTKGIPRRSILSSFFGAVYLSKLDQAFSSRSGIFYCRYMDDVLVLTKTKRQYTKARKQLFKILKELKLQVSPHKTRMGQLSKGFHFLGINFEASQNPQTQTQETQLSVHARTCRRALDKIKAMRNNAVHPAIIQRYLTRWASWWHHTTGLSCKTIIQTWIKYVTVAGENCAWLGQGLLLTKPEQTMQL